MKLTNSIILPALCWSARLTAAAKAHISLHDPRPQHRPDVRSRTLSPVTARLVLAQRAGVEDYHKLDLFREEVIDAINAYGVQTPLFPTEDDEHIKKAFILVEDLPEPEADLPVLRSYPSFQLSPAPASSASRGLFVDLAKQSNPQGLAQLSDEDVLEVLMDKPDLNSGRDTFYVAKSKADFEAMFNNLVKEKTWSITAIITPGGQSSVKDESKFQWGTYEMPGKRSMLQKRARAPNEEPLTTGRDDFKPVASSSAPKSAAANNTMPLRGILPACFTSQSACESATRNCTGHGTCSKKYHDPDSLGPSGDKAGRDCWSCHCQSTKSSNGKQTTVWAGPACQKQDVSVQFWLIALFSVGMVFVVGFAIGNIWEMGSQELPSVIGAGVSGPTARK